jgi:hypothetical protein
MWEVTGDKYMYLTYVHLVGIKEVTGRMCGVGSLKIIDAHQAKFINNYRNTSCKLLRTNAPVCYNKICRNSKLTDIDINHLLLNDLQRSHK